MCYDRQVIFFLRQWSRLSSRFFDVLINTKYDWATTSSTINILACTNQNAWELFLARIQVQHLMLLYLKSKKWGLCACSLYAGSFLCSHFLLLCACVQCPPSGLRSHCPNKATAWRMCTICTMYVCMLECVLCLQSLFKPKNAMFKVK